MCKVVEEYARQENARIQAELDKTREERDRANARADRSDLEVAALRKELADLKASVNQGTVH